MGVWQKPIYPRIRKLEAHVKVSTKDSVKAGIFCARCRSNNKVSFIVE